MLQRPTISRIHEQSLAADTLFDCQRQYPSVNRLFVRFLFIAFHEMVDGILAVSDVLFERPVDRFASPDGILPGYDPRDSLESLCARGQLHDRGRCSRLRRSEEAK
jgi:hypothetical protein